MGLYPFNGEQGRIHSPRTVPPAGTGGDELDRTVLLASSCARAGQSAGCCLIADSYERNSERYWTGSDFMEKIAGGKGSLRFLERFGMRLVERLKNRTGALRVAEVAELFGVTPQHIYRMAAGGRIPSFRISGSVRFDPEDVASWLEEKQGPDRRVPARRVAA